MGQIELPIEKHLNYFPYKRSILLGKMSLFNPRGIKSPVGNPDSRVSAPIIPFSATMRDFTVSRGAVGGTDLSR